MKQSRQGWHLVAWVALGVASGIASVPAPAARAAGTDIVVTLDGFVGLPLDSLSRGAFMDAFRATFDDPELVCEKREDGGWRTSGERRNHFRLVDVAAPDAAWSLSLSLGTPPDVRALLKHRKATEHQGRPGTSNIRASRGLTLLVTAQQPGPRAQGAEPTAVKFAVYFPDARRVLVPSDRLPGGGYAYPWADAGRVVARAALETLQRMNGELAEDERADLAPAVRTEDTP